MPGFSVTDLRCESVARPLGLDVATPHLSWRLADDAAGLRQTACRVRVGRSDADAADVWDSGRLPTRATRLAYAGPPLESKQRYVWSVTVEAGGDAVTSPPSWFETGLLAPGDFRARWINHGRDLHNWQSAVLPTPLLRHAFDLPAAAISARLYVCGLGYFEATINGARVGDRVLQPVVSQYEKRARYVTHDVTSLLRPGPNAVGVMLGNGWYNAHTTEVWHFDKAPWRDYPKLWLQLEATLADGRTVRIDSDATWKIADGPITFDGLRNGETYDARREIAGWADAGFDDSAWASAVVVPGPGGVLASQWGPACHVAETIRPVARRPLAGGVTLLDFGQNLTGHARVRLSGAAGRTLTLAYAETIDAAGDFDLHDNARFIKSGDFQTDRFTPATDAEATWETRFAYHGFRYVRASGLPASATLEVEARVVETELPTVGDFVSSDDVLNRIHAATRWSFRGNFTGIPTDCPHREKNGWTGDAHLAVETGLINFRVGPAYRDWVESIADAQRPGGQLPGIVPTGGWSFNWGSGPAWDAAFLLIPWNVYLYTGDDAMIRRHYAAMKKYVTFCGTMASGHVLSFGLGDWCHVDRDRIAPVPLTSTAFYYLFARLMTTFAGLLGEAADAEAYAGLGRDVRAAFDRRFYRGDGTYGDGEKSGGGTGMAAALYLAGDLGPALVQEGERAKVVAKLVADVKAHDVRPDFGILGAKWVPRALADNGHVDLAYRLLTQRGYPGWAHWIESGATTLYETWDGKSSRNHIMFGDIDAWMFHHVAGLRPDPQRPGFGHALVRPNFPAALDHFSAWHETPNGRLGSAWQRDGDAVRLTVIVPPNGTATVTLPDGKATDVAAGEHAFLFHSPGIARER